MKRRITLKNIVDRNKLQEEWGMPAPGHRLYDKISAIKGLRALTGMGLKEAKETIEAAAFEPVSIELDITDDEYQKKDGIALMERGGIGVTLESIREQLISDMQKLIEKALVHREYQAAQHMIVALERIDDRE